MHIFKQKPPGAQYPLHDGGPVSEADAHETPLPGSGTELMVDQAVEKRVVRKFDRHLMPLVFVLYLLASLDRSNIGNARIAGMYEDLKLNDSTYTWLLTIFYISYICFGFAILAWKVFPAHALLAFVVLGWGAVATCQAATTTWAGMMVCRFLLGGFEIAFGPGIVYALTFFYLRHEIGFREGIFVSAAPLANCFAAALAYGITSGDAAIPNWKLLFLVEGLPVVVPMAIVAFFYFPDSPQQARFLDGEEKKAALARGVRQVGTGERIGAINFRDTFETLRDPKPWLTALMYFSCNVSFSSLPVFLPTILRDMGFSGIQAQGLSAPPYFLSFLVTLGMTYIADRIQQRGLVIIAMSILGGVGYLMLATMTAVGPRYAGTFLAASGIFPCIGVLLPWTSNNLGSDTTRGMGFVLLMLIGQCGPLLGTRLYPTSQSPRYVKGQSVCAAFMFFTMFLAILYRTFLAWENRKLDKQYGTLEVQKARAQAQGLELETKGTENYSPSFRYVL